MYEERQQFTYFNIPIPSANQSHKSPVTEKEIKK
jgi:hypothetical protein